MKKKLLTILLSVFVMITAFTTNVFAQTTTLGDILPDNIPTTTETGWVSRDGQYVIYYTPGLSLIVSQGGQQKRADLLTKEVQYIDNSYYTCNGNPKLYVDVNGKVYMICVTMSGVDVYFDVPIKFTDILDTVPNGFPSTNIDGEVPDDAWISSSMLSIFYYNNKQLVRIASPMGNIAFDSSSLFYRDADGNYTSVLHAQSTDFPTKLIMNDSGTLQKIESEYMGLPVVLEPLGNRITLESIFEDYASDFPISQDVGWINDNDSSVKIFYDVGYDALCFNSESEITLSFPSYSLVTPCGTYYSFIDLGISANFMINDSVLKCIEIVSVPNSGGLDFTKAIGTYSAPKTIADILDTVVGGFPTTEESGWINANGKKMFIQEYSPNNLFKYGDFGCFVNELVTMSGQNYLFDYSGVKFTFGMNNGVLEKVDVTVDGSEDNSGTYLPNNMTYEVTDGNQMSIDISKGENVTFTSKADFSRFVGVKVDGTIIDPSNYTAVSGSTKVTVNASYLNTLTVGNHIIEIVSNNGIASATFTITNGGASSSTSSHTYIIPNTGVR